MTEALSGHEVLAIDAGTQGVSIILWCPASKRVLGTGEAKYAYDYIPGLPEGRLEQYPHYWSDAIAAAMEKLRQDVRNRLGLTIKTVAGIGVTGHMHCMVRRDGGNGAKPFGCDMWNDPRGGPESRELSGLFHEHMPARWTVCHILASMRADPESWKRVDGVTVTSGSIVHDLTGEWVLGPGDASGMMGNLDADGQFDRNKANIVDRAAGHAAAPLHSMLPRVVPAGDVAGRLNSNGATLLGGLPEGIPVAAPEGDQQSVLVGAAVDELELALSAGTSFTGNLPVSAHIMAESEAFNVLHTPDAKTMLMVCARNGTVGFAQYVEGLVRLTGESFGEIADRLTDLARDVPVDAYGTVLLPFFQGENVAELPDARASLHHAGLDILSNPGLMARLLLEGPCMTMRYGLELVKNRAGQIRNVQLTGGALKSKGGYAPQLYADILGVPVVARHGDEEGTAKGAAILAAYMVECQEGRTPESLAAFARTQVSGEEKVWEPSPAADSYSERYRLFETHVRDMQSRRA